MTGTLAVVATRAILHATGGEPAVPLDDAFIHFQYARSFWEGHGLAYAPGGAPVPGATSLLWPFLLSVPYGLGLRGTSIIWAAWAFGWVSLGLLGYETRRVAERLVSADGALAAELMVLCFGGHVWFAASGMEVVPLAFLLMRTARRAAELAEAPERRAPPWELLALATLGPLLRPEGALAALMVAGTLGVRARGRKKAWALVALAALLLPGLVNWLLSGSATTTTAAVKWLLLSPYLEGRELFAAVLDNVRLLFRTLLDGEVWSAVFLPKGSAVVLWPAVPALIIAGVRRGARARALLVAVVALGMLMPTTYDSFLWNRLRYLWPFTAAWFVGVAALGDAVGALAARLDPSLARFRLLASGVVIGCLLSHLGWTIDDLSTSANAIRSQQVALGRWARDNLPDDAVIGVNDTGAIAYLSGHRTFDVVGLTTRGEARYWVAGAGSRFEHYERLGAAHLPTHFFVYEGWFGLRPLLGELLTQRTVPGATILGGETMVARRASYAALGSGARPSDAAFSGCPLVDELDVSDLESEAAHDYALFDAVAAENVALEENGRVDGAREERTLEQFVLRHAPGGRWVARIALDEARTVEVRAAGHVVFRAEVQPDAWRELVVPVPSGLPAGAVGLTLEAGGAPFTALHYWSFGACGHGHPERALAE